MVALAVFPAWSQVLGRSLAGLSRISSGISEGICKWMAQSGREFLNIRVSCGQ